MMNSNNNEMAYISLERYENMKKEKNLLHI